MSKLIFSIKSKSRCKKDESEWKGCWLNLDNAAVEQTFAAERAHHRVCRVVQVVILKSVCALDAQFADLEGADVPTQETSIETKQAL